MRPLRRGPGIARMCALGIDARRMRARGSRDVVEMAHASRWIAANLCSIRGVPFERRATQGRVVGVAAANLMHLCSELAARPSLVDAELLPLAWRVALRGLGLPLLDRPVEDALDAGIDVVVPARAHERLLTA